MSTEIYTLLSSCKRWRKSQIVTMMNWTCNDWRDSERDSLKVGPTHGDKLNHYQDSAAVRKIAHCGKNSKNKFSLLRDTAFIMCFWASFEKYETFRHTQRYLYWWVLDNYFYVKTNFNNVTHVHLFW